MWEIEEYERAGVTILIFYYFPEPIPEGQDKTQYVRGQITCNDKTEAALWKTVLPILNFKEE